MSFIVTSEAQETPAAVTAPASPDPTRINNAWRAVCVRRGIGNNKHNIQQ